jgi:hypothetical protein
MVGKTTLDVCSNANGDYDKFLVLDTSGNVDYRTGTEVISDIGLGTAALRADSYFALTGHNHSTTYAPLTHGVSAGYTPYANSTTTLANSPMYISGTNVGIGTTNPQYKLHVSGGSINVSSDSYICRLGSNAVGTFSNHAFYVMANDGIKISVATNGNVGIMTGVPQYKLDVDGDVRIANISGLATTATTFLTHTAGVVQSRTSAQVLEDISPSVVSYSSSTTVGGFSTIYNHLVNYIKVGKLVTISFYIDGVSNSADFTFTIPSDCNPSSTYSGAQPTNPIVVGDNGNTQSAPGLVDAGSVANTIRIYKTLLSAGFTTSGIKSAQGTITYGTD